MPNSGTLSAVAGLAGTQGYADGVGTNARFQEQYGIGVYDSGSKALITESYTGCTIRCIDLSVRPQADPGTSAVPLLLLLLLCCCFCRCCRPSQGLPLLICCCRCCYCARRAWRLLRCAPSLRF